MNGKSGGTVIHQPKTPLNIIGRKDGRDTLVFFNIIEGTRAQHYRYRQEKRHY
jgi:hypothetical protein